MEIRIKINQKNNPYFAFMDFNDRLHPYYKHLLRAITSGNYTPKPQPVEQKVESVEKKSGEQQLEQKTNKVEEEQDDEEDSDSDGEYELHPLLMGSRTTSSNTATNSSNQVTSSTNGHSGSVSLIISCRSECHCLCLFFFYVLSVQKQTLCMPYLAAFPIVLNYF